MPCTDGGPSPGEHPQDYADAFCSACRALEAAGVPIPIGAQKLWRKHKKEDEDRQRWEDQDRKRAAIKKTAMKKLSAVERDALGLR